MKNQENLTILSIEELQKLKLTEEILALKKPIWKQTQFISIVVTLIIAFAGTSITILQIQQGKLNAAKETSEELLLEKKQAEDKTKVAEDKTKQAHEKFQQANLKLSEALGEKTAAVSERSEIKNQLNAIEKIDLIKRENSLRARVSQLQNIAKELEKRNNGYKEGFINSFVTENPDVQKDILRFAKEGKKEEMEKWLKAQFLYTALNRYEKYVVENTNTFIP